MSEPVPPTSPVELVYPVLVGGTAIAHLAVSVLDVHGAGYRAICPLAALITAPLRLIVTGERFVWCGSCAEWAAAAGVELPTAGGDLPGAGSAGQPAGG